MQRLGWVGGTLAGRGARVVDYGFGSWDLNMPRAGRSFFGVAGA